MVAVMMATAVVTATATATKTAKVTAGGGGNGGGDSGGDGDGDGDGDNNNNQTTINLTWQQKKRWQRRRRWRWQWRWRWRWRWQWRAVAAVTAARCSGLRGSSSKQNAIAYTCFLCCFLVRKLNVCYTWHSIVRYCGRGHWSFLSTSTYVSGNPAKISESGIPDQINLALE